MDSDANKKIMTYTRKIEILLNVVDQEDVQSNKPFILKLF